MWKGLCFALRGGKLRRSCGSMDFAGLPGAAIEPAQPDASTVNALVEAGIIVLCEGRILLDRTMALILQSAAESQWFARAEGPGGKALLYVGEKMCVLLTDAGGGALLLEPVRDLSAARPLFQKGAARLGARLQYLAAARAGRVRRFAAKAARSRRGNSWPSLKGGGIWMQSIIVEVYVPATSASFDFRLPAMARVAKPLRK